MPAPCTGRIRSGMSNLTPRLLTALLIAGVALAMASSISAATLEPSRTIETPFFQTSLDESGNLERFFVLRFRDDLLTPSYRTEPGKDALVGGLIFGPLGQLDAGSRLSTRISTSGSFVSTDDQGSWLPEGLELERTYRFHDDNYLVDIDVVLRNRTDQSLALATPMGKLAFWLGPILGGQLYGSAEVVAMQGEELEELSTAEELKETPSGVKWIGARGSYYASVLEEKSGRGNYVYSLVPFVGKDGKVVQGVRIGFRYQYPDIRGGEEVKLSFRLYLGSKQEDALSRAGYLPLFDNWDGMTGGIGKVMFKMLKLFHSVTGSWGIAILLLTLLVKILLHPLNLKQLRSMGKLQELQPKMQDLKKRYPDTQQFQQEVQKLYTEHNVNPLGGCFPIFLQIPIFIALYSSLMGAIELKKVSFLWLPDLAKADPYGLLPVMFAGSIYVSSKLTASPQMDKTQQSIMQIMPIMMLMMMMNVPSGVMIYLAGQSVLSLFETRYNKAVMAREDALEKARKPSTPASVSPAIPVEATVEKVVKLGPKKSGDKRRKKGKKGGSPR